MTNDYRAIDPLALVLSNAAYVRLTLPDPNPEEIKVQVRQLVQRMNPAERRVTLENIRTFETILKAVEGEFQHGAAEAPRTQQVQAR